jgi:hypothetical protein
MSTKEQWEINLDNDMESIRASYKSIRRNYYILMGIMLTWIISTVIGVFV